MTRLEKNGKVIEASAIQNSLKRTPESFNSTTTDLKKIKLEASVSNPSAQTVQSVTFDKIQSKSCQQATNGSNAEQQQVQLSQATNHFTEPKYQQMINRSATPKQTQASNNLQGGNVLYTRPSSSQQNIRSINSSSYFQKQSSGASVQQVQPNQARPYSPNTRHRRQLRFQYYKKYLNDLFLSEQSQLRQAEQSMQVECKAKLTLSEKQDILRRYKEQQMQYKAKLVQIQQLLLKLHHFEKKKYDTLVQQNRLQQQQQQQHQQHLQQQNQQQQVLYIQQNQHQHLNSGQYQFDSDQHLYGQQQMVNQNWGNYQEQHQSADLQVSPQQFGYQWNYEQQQFNTLVYTKDGVPAQQQLISPNQGQQISVPTGSFTSSPQSGLSGYSPQSSTSTASLLQSSESIGYHSNSDEKLSPNLNQAAFNQPPDLKAEFDTASHVNSDQFATQFQDPNQGQLLNISSSQLFNSNQQFDFNQDQFLDLFSSGQQGTATSSQSHQTVTTAANQTLSNNPIQNSGQVVKAEPANPTNLWDELFSMINDD